MTPGYESVYVVGARGGLALGPAMSLAMVLLGASAYSSMWALPALACCLAVPVLAYFVVARAYKANPAYGFSALWLTGICSFFFGAVIMGAVVVAALKWWQPGFMQHIVTQLIEVYSRVPDPNATTMVDTLRKMSEAGALPGPIDCALELIYGAVFSGSLLSMIYAAVVRRTARRPGTL